MTGLRSEKTITRYFNKLANDQRAGKIKNNQLHRGYMMALMWVLGGD